MNYTIVKRDAEIEVKFNIPAEEWANHVDKTYNKNKNKFSAPGFRKGHVPRKILENLYGVNFLFEDTLDEVFPVIFDTFLNENNELDVISQPSLTQFDINDENKATEITCIVQISPKVTLGQYKGITIAKRDRVTTDAEFDEAVDRLLLTHSRIVSVERAVQDGDEVNIDFSGSIDGVVFDGGTAEGQDLVIGSKSFIPGFEEQIIGMNIGEERDIFVKFPDNYRAENLKGKDSVFSIKLNGVKEKQKPVFDDEFVKDISEFDTVEAYKADMRQKMDAEKEKRAKVEEENNLLDTICGEANVPESKHLIEKQAKSAMAELESSLKAQELKLDDYLKYTKKTLGELQEVYYENAKKIVKNRLVISEIIKAENIKLEENDIDAGVTEFIESMPGDKKKPSKEEVFRNEYFMNFIANDLLFKKLIEFLWTVNKAE